MELFRAAGLPFAELTRRTDVTFPRRVLHQEYQTPAVLDELIEVRSWVSRIGTTSITLSYEILGETGVVRATGYMVLVAVDPTTFKKVPVPAEVVERLQQFSR